MFWRRNGNVWKHNDAKSFISSKTRLPSPLWRQKRFTVNLRAFLPLRSKFAKSSRNELAAWRRQTRHSQFFATRIDLEIKFDLLCDPKTISIVILDNVKDGLVCQMPSFHWSGKSQAGAEACYCICIAEVLVEESRWSRCRVKNAEALGQELSRLLWWGAGSCSPVESAVRRKATVLVRQAMCHEWKQHSPTNFSAHTG